MSLRTAAAATATVSALLALPLAPARGADGQGEGRLFLTVSGSRNTWIRGVELVCPGAGGHHPHAAEACAGLEQGRGRPDARPTAAGERVCTMEHDPVTASADGSWRGAPVAWRRTFPNACALDTATGPVFRF
ncbi:hypothetical protein GCM10010218_09630 [Streptomyces mashuensis]|uniref:Subtilisin inhibitor domain-containing protein n=1 Tax=Streptomyces mashuensis TaxID=33904 RepID=A0A919EB54_9ACTN|nr:SSI family serine proteinase inhibitor [Streptomyces mashuensis]GHF30414.1 hypothetical protein GCM10010218_09630 [Streptomyces mashuensis]